MNLFSLFFLVISALFTSLSLLSMERPEQNTRVLLTPRELQTKSLERKPQEKSGAGTLMMPLEFRVRNLKRSQQETIDKLTQLQSTLSGYQEDVENNLQSVRSQQVIKDLKEKYAEELKNDLGPDWNVVPHYQKFCKEFSPENIDKIIAEAPSSSSSSPCSIM